MSPGGPRSGAGRMPTRSTPTSRSGARADDARVRARRMTRALFIVGRAERLHRARCPRSRGAVTRSPKRILALPRGPCRRLRARRRLARPGTTATTTTAGTSRHEPDFVDTWPVVHCVGGTYGAAYDDVFDTSRVTHHLKKGQGKPAYSIFEGVSDGARPRRRSSTPRHPRHRRRRHRHRLLRAVRPLSTPGGRAPRARAHRLVAGVHPVSSDAALTEIAAAGAELAVSED